MRAVWEEPEQEMQIVRVFPSNAAAKTQFNNGGKAILSGVIITWVIC